MLDLVFKNLCLFNMKLANVKSQQLEQSLKYLYS